MRVSGDSDSIYLFHGNDPAACVHIPIVRESDVFGEGSALVVTTQVPNPLPTAPGAGQPLTGSTGFHLSVILLLAMYASLVFAFRGSIGQLLKAMRPDTNPGQSYSEQTMVFRQFLNWSSLLTIFMSAILMSKAVETFTPDVVLQLIPERLCPFVPLIILSASFLVYGYKYIVVKSARFITGNSDFFDTHRYIGQVTTAAGMFFTTPVVILCALGPGGAGYALTAIATGLSCAAYLLFAIRSMIFFTRRGVFILQWILYLCTVEIFPVSLLVTLASRH